MAGLVMAHSDAVRERTLNHLAEAKRQANTAAGKAAAERQAIVNDTLEDRAVKRVCDWLRRKIPELAGDNGWTARADITRKITSINRDYLDSAVDHLTQSGEIEVNKTSKTTAGHGGDGTRYRLRRSDGM